MRTEICITVDTEFSIAGAFEHPEKYAPLSKPVVECVVDGKEMGLGFILDKLAQHRCTATFFVEPLNSAYFGDEPMKGVAQRIIAAGHDVELHLHPMWLQLRGADWRKKRPNDSCAGRSPEALEEIIAHGLAAFRRWGVPDPVAVRSGNLQCDLAFYEALSSFGIRLASNVGLAIFRPQDVALQLTGGRHWINGVLELPVLTYAHAWLSGSERLRSLAITAASWAETKSLLWQAHRTGVSPVVVLTHPFEFVKQRGFRYDALRRNDLTQARLARLIRFVEEHEHEFEFVTFRDRAAAWLAMPPAPNPTLRVPLVMALRRMVANGISDMVLPF